MPDNGALFVPRPRCFMRRASCSQASVATETGASAETTEISSALMQQGRQASRAIGAIFFAVFGAFWLLCGAYLAHQLRPLTIILPIVIASILVMAAIRVLMQKRAATVAFRRTSEHRRTQRRFLLINILQWVAIAVAIILLLQLELARYIIPAIMLVVGVHMLPLARVFRHPPHYLTGALLIATALVYPMATSGPESPAGCFTAGAVLWLSVLGSLHAASR